MKKIYVARSRDPIDRRFGNDIYQYYVKWEGATSNAYTYSMTEEGYYKLFSYITSAEIDFKIL